jgi:excisionase family DNA binding protein
MRLTYTVHEVAAMIGVSTRLVYDEIQRGNINAIHIGRRRIIPRSEVERLVGPIVEEVNS